MQLHFSTRQKFLVQSYRILLDFTMHVSVQRGRIPFGLVLCLAHTARHTVVDIVTNRNMDTSTTSSWLI